MVSSNKNTEGYNKTGLKLLTARVECKTEEEPMEGERELFLGDGLVGESWLG